LQTDISGIRNKQMQAQFDVDKANQQQQMDLLGKVGGAVSRVQRETRQDRQEQVQRDYQASQIKKRQSEQITHFNDNLKKSGVTDIANNLNIIENVKPEAFEGINKINDILANPITATEFAFAKRAGKEGDFLRSVAPDADKLWQSWNDLKMLVLRLKLDLQ
jgi:hypothetical protein